jgi:hypothetical protein
VCCKQAAASKQRKQGHLFGGSLIIDSLIDQTSIIVRRDLSHACCCILIKSVTPSLLPWY